MLDFRLARKWYWSWVYYSINRLELIMKHWMLILLLLSTSFYSYASDCSGKSWKTAYRYYTTHIDQLNTQIDNYNVILSQSKKHHFYNYSGRMDFIEIWRRADPTEIAAVEQQYLSAKSAVQQLDEINLVVEALTIKFNKTKHLWQQIGDDCMADDELGRNDKAIKNGQAADIGKKEANDVLARIARLRERYLTEMAFIKEYSQTF